ncbi:MAG: two-component system, NtrC family, sensor kinase [Burkholderiales bacterium]
MSSSLAQFDRDVTLAELLRAVPRKKLETALNGTIGHGWRVVDGDGTAILGSNPTSGAAAIAIPLRIDIEVIGRLQASDVPRERIEAAATWLEMVLASAYRYQMAADLHLEAVNADYEALQRKHAALQESEERYRELAEKLDQRVKEQVDVIERAQRQLYQAEKMASIGSLSAGMAHEINNPIGFIRSNLATASIYIDKMQKTLDAFHSGDLNGANAAWHKLDIDFVLEDFPGLLAESITGADRIARIVANLKAYANIDSASAVGAVNLNDAVHAAVGIAGDQLPGNITLAIDLQPLPDIVCDQSRMNQVLFALIQNARQAIGGEGGQIRIASRATADEIRIAVSDNGCGIKHHILTRIFDPFFTTHDVGKGMGLGLTVSRDIVSAHRGRIDVETTVAVGSTFTVCLPYTGGPAQAVVPGSAS